MRTVKVKSPRTGEMTNIEDMSREELAEFCAWNTETELSLLWSFIAKQGLQSEADAFLEEVAREEIHEGFLEEVAREEIHEGSDEGGELVRENYKESVVTRLKPGTTIPRGTQGRVILFHGVGDQRREVEWFTADWIEAEGGFVIPETVNGFWYGLEHEIVNGR